MQAGADFNTMSCPGLARASTPYDVAKRKGVDTRTKCGHDDSWGRVYRSYRMNFERSTFFARSPTCLRTKGASIVTVMLGVSEAL